MQTASGGLGQTASSSSSPSKKVSHACQRCRRQKLKCDIQRPCTLCIRADANCVDSKPDPWKAYSMNDKPKKGRNGRLTENGNATKRLRSDRFSNTLERQPVDQLPKPNEVSDKGTPLVGATTSLISAYPETSNQKTSSTINLIEEAFLYHSSDTPPAMDTSAYSRQSQAIAESPIVSISSQSKHSRPRSNASRTNFSAARDFDVVLPEREPAMLLLNTYFDRVHWFILVFYQDEFRASFNKLYESKDDQRYIVPELIGFTSTLLAAFVIALQHAGTHRKNLLRQKGIEPDVLRDKILITLKANLIDILALGSLESVQTCVLLGSYYLYHGQPELAWPVCGCALRIAQALGLHREQSTRNGLQTQSSALAYRRDQARKRAWWAVYEIETISSMLYGYPLSISDSVCNVEFLDHLLTSQQGTIGAQTSATPAEETVTLLSYKHFMSRLTVIIKAVLDQLYQKHQETSEASAQQPSRNSRLQQIVIQVTKLENRLQDWERDLPSKLRLIERDMSEESYQSLEDIERDIGASGQQFETHLFCFQALALRLACDNTRILIHRPLLSYQLTNRISLDNLQNTGDSSAQIPDPFSYSFLRCRDAALRSSDIGKSEAFSFSATTYAAAFFGMHLFTAGVTLCIMTSLKPLSVESHESKLAVHRIMAMQSSLKETSILAAQGLKVLEKLVRLVLEQETRKMFEFPTSSATIGNLITSGPDAQTETPTKPPSYLRPRHEDVPTSLRSQPGIRGQFPTDTTINDDMSLPANTLDHTLLDPGFDKFNLFDTDFQENTDMTRALQGVEQVMTSGYVPTVAENDYFASNVPIFDEDFIEQEQGWMWTFDFFQNS